MTIAWFNNWKRKHNLMTPLEIALQEIGYKETPAGSNKTKYGEWYGLDGVAWCAVFVSWCFNEAGIPIGHIDTDKGYHYVPSAWNYWKKNGKIVSSSPQPGDIVVFDWNHDLKFDHTGIFVKDLGNGMFQSIEGNTSVGNDSNGGEVMIRQRYYSVAKFINPIKSKP